MESFPRTLTTRNGLALTIDLARPKELDEICEFLRRHFFSTEPNCYLVSNCPTKSHMNEFVSCFLREPVSLTVRDSNGNLVAVRLNELEERLSTSTNDCDSTEEQNDLIVSLLGALGKGIDLFERYNTNKVFDLAMMAVDHNYGGLGLASTLVSISFELARSCGAGVVRVCAVNEYAARVASKYGMQTVKTIDYATFEFKGDRPLARQKNLLNKHPVARYMVGMPI